MEQVRIERDTPVRAADGELGRVKYVVVDPQTREVTEIVVGRDRQEWLIPMTAVTGMDGEALLLDGPRDRFRAAPAFHREQFESVSAAQVAAEHSGQALHGGAPLQAATEDVVVAGETSAVEETQRLPRPEWATAPSATMPIVPPVPPMDISQAVPMVAAAMTEAEDDDIPFTDGAGTDVTAEEPEVETLRLEDGAAQHLELAEERLRVEKEEVQAGLVRVRKVVREWIERIDVPLREERLVLEILPGSGAVTIDGRRMEPGDVLEVPLLEERATAIKETVVSEDVVIRKETFEVEETFQERLRREELVVEGDGDLNVEDETETRAIDEYETTRT
jgi:uncharacterized protein (TIGR02271 family)